MLIYCNKLVNYKQSESLDNYLRFPLTNRQQGGNIMNNRVYRAARPKKTKNGIPLPLAYEIGQAMRNYWNNYTINPEEIVYRSLSHAA